MSVLVAVWGDQLREMYGAELPDDYLTFDCETTGTDLREDVPLEIGHCVVRGRKVTHRGGLPINWARLWTGAKRRWFWEKVDRICDIMRQKGPWRLDRDYLRRCGYHPKEVLGHYSSLFATNRTAGAFFAGHNAWRFDVPLLEVWFEDVDGVEPFRFGNMEVLDTGGMEKAVQLDWPPYPDQTMEDYFLAVANKPIKGVYWSMERCIEKYNFAKRYGIDPDDNHQAEADAYCCHLLYEEHRFNGNSED